MFSLLILISYSKSVTTKLGSKSTALDVINYFGEGKYLSGKSAIVTGGNSGIGLETCKALALAGCQVTLCSRSRSAAEYSMANEILKPGLAGYTVPDANKYIKIKELDLERFSSIESFVNDYLDTSKGNSLDFLVLNAGIMAVPTLQYTEKGFEKQIGVNHFGHAYLTKLLSDKLRKQNEPSRVIVVASRAHQTIGNCLDLKDINFKNGRFYTPWKAYCQSKLANILFSKGYADYMKSLDSEKVTSVSVHPGVIKSNLWNKYVPWFVTQFMGIFWFDKSIPQGAATIIWGCLAPHLSEDIYRGAYLSDCDIISPSKEACDNKTRLTLWNITQDLIDQQIEPIEK